MNLVLVNPAAETLLTKTQLRMHARTAEAGASEETPSIEDASVLAFAATAQQHIEQFTGPLIMSTWDYFLDAFPEDRRDFRIPVFKLESVESIAYTKADGVTVTWGAASTWEADTVNNPGRVVLAANASWPSDQLKASNAVKVRIRAGWPNAADVPAPITQAALLLFSHYYENREGVVIGERSAIKSEPLAKGIDTLLWNYRVW